MVDAKLLVTGYVVISAIIIILVVNWDGMKTSWQNFKRRYKEQR